MDGNAPLEVWFDGSCELCRASVAWARRRDAADRLVFRDAATAPAGSAPAGAEQLAAAMWVRRWDGSVAGGFDGVRAVLVALPRWRWLAALLAAPPLSWLGPPVYRLVARHRHRLSARESSGRCGPDDPGTPC